MDTYIWALLGCVVGGVIGVVLYRRLGNKEEDIKEVDPLDRIQGKHLKVYRKKKK